MSMRMTQERFHASVEGSFCGFGNLWNKTIPAYQPKTDTKASTLEGRSGSSE